jgi:hypothetical protein
MLPCNEVTRLCASEELGRASVLRRLGVRFHLLMCTHCSRYVRELRLIGVAVRDEFRRLTLDRDQVDRLEAAIRRQLRAERGGENWSQDG